MAKRRPQQCTICSHRELAQIDMALARGVAAPAIARRFKLGVHSVYRHARSHLPPQLRASLLAGPDLAGVDLDRLKESELQSLLANLVSLRHRLFAALDTAEEYNDGGMLTRVASALHANLELTGKLLGDLGIGSTTINNVLILPQWVETRIALVRALEAFPEARIEVARVLHQIESKAADDISNTKRDLAQ